MRKKTKIFVVAFLLVATLGAVVGGTLCGFSDLSVVTVAEAVVLKSGSRGQDVRNVQTKLKNWGYMTGSVDGIYGPKTVEAVKYFQRVNKLSVDGIVGNATAKKLGVTLSGTSSGQGSGGYTSSDTYLLAKLIYAEARGEPYIGQVAVGAVVLNRVRDSKFPNTISGVIYQPWAFTCVNDGQINLSPNDTATRAAKDAMNGWDPSNGCIYYFNPATATSSWIWSRPIMLKIGQHNFTK